jgi:nicotinate dehydrogenase subunit B
MTDKSSSKEFTRREFIKTLGGGIVVSFTVGDWRGTANARQRGLGRENPEDFNAYLRVGEDGKITCFTGKVELGQGIVTSLAQIAAEELDVPLESVDMVMGDTAICPWDMGTFGSRSIRYFGPALREAAAEARAVLIHLASEHLNVPVARLKTEEGFVLDTENPAKRVSYGALTRGKRIERRAEPKPGVKPRGRHMVSGKPAPRKDALLKVTGKAVFTGDIRTPDMLYARILRPPAHGARLKSVDLSQAELFEGARIIRDGELVAALHRSSDQAEAALSKVKAEYEEPEVEVDDQSIHDHLLKKAPRGDVVEARGDLEQGTKLSVMVVEGTYLVPYVAHAPLEPHTATVKIEDNAATVWASTQRPFGAQDEVAQSLGMPREEVRVITPFVGGGFGGKTRNRQVINPDGAKAQIEGCITMGLGYALSEEIHFKGGRIRDRNFDTYEIPRFSWAPKIEAILVDNADLPAQGGGEPPIVNMGAVIANAVYDASGARLFRLPMTPARIKESLKGPSNFQN